MAWWSRKQAAEFAEGLTDHLKLIENVRSLQVGQKEIADAVAKLGEHIRRLESEMIALKSDVKYEALKEAQSAVLAVQTGFNERLQDVALKVRDVERDLMQIEASGPRLLGNGEKDE